MTHEYTGKDIKHHDQISLAAVTWHYVMWYIICTGINLQL